MKLHPPAVVLVVTVGLNQAGVVGALLAVPLLAVIKTAVQTFAGHGDREVTDRAGTADRSARPG